MNRVDSVSARYVEALFGLAAKQGVLPAVREDVEKIGAEMKVPAVRRFLLDPRFSTEERLAKVAPLVDSLSPLTSKFVRLLFQKDREPVLLTLAETFRQRLLQEASAVEGVVETARPLDGAEIDRLATELSRQLSKKVYLENSLVPELLGGFRVKVGHSMLDRSIAGRLESLRTGMMNAPVGGASSK